MFLKCKKQLKNSISLFFGYINQVFNPLKLNIVFLQQRRLLKEKTIRRKTRSEVQLEGKQIAMQKSDQFVFNLSSYSYLGDIKFIRGSNTDKRNMFQGLLLNVKRKNNLFDSYISDLDNKEIT